MDKVFSSAIFWTFMGLQALGTGGFILLALTMDIKYMDADDSPGMAPIAIGLVFGLPVACFCFLFAGAAFFNAFHKVSSKKVSVSLLPLQPSKSKIITLPSSIVEDSQSLV